MEITGGATGVIASCLVAGTRFELVSPDYEPGKVPNSSNPQ